MNKQKIIEKLHKQYPNKPIICIPEDKPQEIVCEYESTSEHAEWSEVMAIVGKSEPHYHKKSTERYKVTKGTLNVYLDGEKHVLEKGDELTIKPGPVHYAESATDDECWFITKSEPGWTEEDHIVV